MPNIVKIQLIVFIPSELVSYYAFGYGGTFNGGIKCQPSPTIDLDIVGDASLNFPTPEWGETREYKDDDALPVSGMPNWYMSLVPGAKPIANKTLKRTSKNLNATFSPISGGTHGVHFEIVGANPLLSLAPAIDANIKVGLREDSGKIQYSTEIQHDGFPSYSLSLNEKKVYSHDCVAKKESPSALKPPMDYSSTTAWIDL